MAKIVIAIDTSHQKKYAGLVSGFQNDFDNLYKQMTDILSKQGRRGHLHWSKLSRKIRKKARKEILDSINKSNLHFTIFETKIERNLVKKTYYLNYVPNMLAAAIENWLRNKYGFAEIKVDNDFTVSGVQDGTKHFIENFLQLLCTRLIGKPVTLRKDKRIRATIKQVGGNILEFVAYTTTSKEAKEIQIIDLALGYYLENSEGFDKTKVSYKRI